MVSWQTITRFQTIYFNYSRKILFKQYDVVSLLASFYYYYYLLQYYYLFVIYTLPQSMTFKLCVSTYVCVCVSFYSYFPFSPFSSINYMALQLQQTITILSANTATTRTTTTTKCEQPDFSGVENRDFFFHFSFSFSLLLLKHIFCGKIQIIILRRVKDWYIREEEKKTKLIPAVLFFICKKKAKMRFLFKGERGHC